MLVAGDTRLADGVVLDLEGHEVPLRAVFQHGPVVLVWLRHYGCLFCKEQAAQLRGIKKEIEATGARLVFIGNGNTLFARHFKATLVPDCEVLTDPSTATYRLLGARRGFWTTWTPRSLPATFRALRHGFRQSHTQGYAYLQGGVAIVDSTGAVRWSFVSRFAGHHPSPAYIVSALHRVLEKSAAVQS